MLQPHNEVGFQRNKKKSKISYVFITITDSSPYAQKLVQRVSVAGRSFFLPSEKAQRTRGLSRDPRGVSHKNMRHRLGGFRKFACRTRKHHRALLKNLATSLVKHERIVTTLAKGKELRRVGDRVSQHTWVVCIQLRDLLFFSSFYVQMITWSKRDSETTRNNAALWMMVGS